ncbi:insulysin [Fusarium oxysporum f. sp. lycopersici 4287]|uniref:Insulysin n=1 Tax=Fusarium oxysporum f. sp. lycopersici (strain 4287 / CBS 123668 / FGSC 9935 / NRRL 34936) TaxID=426428 RepID=A0A0J9WUY4_FUSO4|nr:insulysin [Fusarium oxysporum f. sp. lycopersici 4287]KNB18587.1 insulysin [Fusarium oxysporum f. sp. lycopersici 4287]
MYSRELNLYFPFIDEEFMFATQPSRYISHLIGHEGPGSIMSYIRSKGWANGLNAGAYPMCPGTPGIFDMQVCLTEDGLKNYPEIIEIFSRTSLSCFKLKTPASRFTSRISSVMQKTLPRKWLLSGHSRLREFAPDQIEKALATIHPDNSCMWYGTEYRHDKIPNDLMQECKKAFAVSPQDRLPTLHLPHKNQFIPNEPEVEKQEMDEQALNLGTQWKKDDIFWVSRANLIVSLKTPLFYASAENNVKARLFSDLVRDALEMYSYDAELAGLQYKISLDSRGLFLDVSGYDDKLPVLLDQIVTTMRDLDIKKYRLRLEDRDIRTKTLIRGPAFDQLRTKEPFGYIVFSMPRTFSMTYGFRFLIQSEMAPKFLDSRSEAFLVRYADTLEKMNDTEFEGPQRTQCDAAQIKLLTKLEVMEFFNRRLSPVSSRRDRSSIHLQAQGKAEGVDKRQEEAQKNANM